MSSFTANSIVHVDINGPEGKRLEAFYQAVFNWNLDPKGPGYTLVRTPAGGPDAAITETPEASVVFGIAVDNVSASVAAAIAAGGSEIMPVTDNGWVTKAQVADPAGNLVTLIQR